MRTRTRTIIRPKLEAARHLRLDSRRKTRCDTCLDDPTELSSELVEIEDESTTISSQRPRTAR